MFEYGPTAVAASGAVAQPPPAFGAREGAFAVVDAVRRRKAFIFGCAAACALLGFAATKLLTPRYVAVAQIYVDPGILPGAGQDAPAPGQDSNGFINYVESQSLILTSRAVMARVVADEKLDVDPDFIGSSRFTSLLGAPPTAADREAAAAAALGSRIRVRRPERTFVIDLSVFDRNPEKAADLANATARAFIAVSASWQSDSSRQTAASLVGRLEALRQRVLEAERKVEDYKAANGLVGTGDLLVSDQQLRDMTAQMMTARAKAAEARARLDQIEDAHRRGGDVAALASQINSASLSALRTQQALARQRLADLTAELGARHPEVIDAKARVSASDAAVNAELARFAQSQRIDYASARQLEASLGRQLGELEAQSNVNSQSSVGLRDLERQADAARGVYQLFVTRSRETGEIQQVEPPRSRIISLATAPKFRSFPPSASLMTAAGLLLGLGLGVAGSVARERWATFAPRRAPIVAPDGVNAPAPAVFAITQHSRLRTAQWRQPLDGIDLAGLGFPTLAPDADGAEFDAILDALGAERRPQEEPPRVLSIAVVGANGAGLRTALAINLTLCAVRRGLRVALIDAAERNALLTRAIRHAARTPVLNKGAFYRAADGVLLALPKGVDAEIGRARPDELLQSIARLREEAVELIVCDGPDPDDGEAARTLGMVDEVVALQGTPDDDGAQSLWRALDDAGVTARAVVRFEAARIVHQKRA